MPEAIVGPLPPGKRPCFANVLTPGIPCLYLCLRAIRSRRFAFELKIEAADRYSSWRGLFRPGLAFLQKKLKGALFYNTKVKSSIIESLKPPRKEEECLNLVSLKLLYPRPYKALCN